MDVQAGRIRAILDSPDSIMLAHEPTLIDGNGKYLIPGLADMHVHINDANNLLLSVANGVTTTRNMAGFSFHLELKKGIENQTLLGPKLYTTGPILEGPEQIWSNAKGGLRIESRESANAAVRRLYQEGYDFIKVYHTLHPDFYEQVLQTADELNIPVVGHLPLEQELELTLNMNQASIEHISPRQWREISPQLSLEKKVRMIGQANKWVCPTLIVIQKVNGTPGDPDLPLEYEEYVDARTRAFWKRRLSGRPSEYELRKQLAKIMYDEGARFIAGTDALNGYILHGFSLHEELKELVGIGLTEYEALQTATLNAAEFVGNLDQAGTITEGKMADLVLLRDNPLEDISHTKSIEGVMVHGKWLDVELLEEIKAAVKQSY